MSFQIEEGVGGTCGQTFGKVIEERGVSDGGGAYALSGVEVREPV